MLDSRLNPPPPHQTVFAPDIQQLQGLNFNLLQLEYGNFPPYLSPLFYSPLQLLPIDRHFTEPVSVPVHDAYNTDAPPQGLHDPQFTCNFCSRTFPQRYQLNTHLKAHTLPFKCSIPSCQSPGFRYSKDLDRHINSVHITEVPGTRRFYCPVETCKHSEAYGNGFARLDNANRHKRTAHRKICEMGS